MNQPEPNQPTTHGRGRRSYRLLWISLAVLGFSMVALRTAVAAQSGEGNPAAARDLWTTVGVWCAAFMTLGILSFLYKDNPFYKVCESILIGVSAAYWMVNGFWSTLVPNLFGKLVPDFVRSVALPDLPVSATPGLDMALAFVPLALGFMLLWRLAPRGGWIAVWPLAFIIGTTAGMRLVASIEADLLAQTVATVRPLVVFDQATSAFNFWGTVGAIVSVVGVLCVLTYFFFSVEHKGVVGGTARLGIWFLMITFGSAFGLTVMGRITLLAQRFEFLFRDWMGIA